MWFASLIQDLLWLFIITYSIVNVVVSYLSTGHWPTIMWLWLCRKMYGQHGIVFLLAKPLQCCSVGCEYFISLFEEVAMWLVTLLKILTSNYAWNCVTFALLDYWQQFSCMHGSIIDGNRFSYHLGCSAFTSLNEYLVDQLILILLITQSIWPFENAAQIMVNKGFAYQSMLCHGRFLQLCMKA